MFVKNGKFSMKCVEKYDMSAGAKNCGYMLISYEI